MVAILVFPPFPAAAASLTSLTLLNTSGSTQATNFITPSFGHFFKKGDIPGASFPQFQLTNGTVCPMSYGGKKTWSDGSWKFASFLLRIPTSIAGSASLTINVFKSATGPTTSARTTTEVSNQTFQVVGAGHGITTSGSWVADVALGITNNTEVAVFHDGDAGKSWRIHQAFRQSGADHGQLVAKHYVMALTDSAGALGGFRYLPRSFQPWYNQDTPAKNWRDFDTLNIQYGAGPSTINSWPFTSFTFTWSSGNSYTAAGNGLYSGSGGSDGSHRSAVAGYLTTTGTLPSGLSTGTIYFGSGTDANSTVDLWTNSALSSGGTATTAGSGTHTFNPIPLVLHFGSYFHATSEGKYNYIQGTGSAAADSTVQVQWNTSYARSTKCLLPWDLTQSFTSPTFSFSWNPTSVGPLTYSINGTGDRLDIGPVSGWAAYHFYNQAYADEKVVRYIGLAAAHWGNATYDLTSRAIVNLAATSYSGLPASVATTYLHQFPSSQVGYTAPPANNGCLGPTDNNTSHIPSMAFYAYAMTGEQQYLDLAVEMGVGDISTEINDVNHRNPTLPAAAAGSGIITLGGQGGTTRAAGWATRDLYHAAGMYPDTAPDTTATGTYVADLAALNAKFPATLMVANNINSYCTTNGLYLTYSPNAGVGRGATPWMNVYFLTAQSFAQNLLEDANAQAFVGTQATFYSHMFSAFGGFTLTGFIYSAYTDGAGQTTPVTDDAHLTVSGAMVDLSWTSGTPGVFTISPTSAYVPHNGDRFLFNPGLSTVIPGGLSTGVPYYVVNVAGSGPYTANFATTPGGSALAVSTTNDTGGETQYLCLVPNDQTISPMSTGIMSTASEVYLQGPYNLITACGFSGMGTLATNTSTRMSSNSISYGDPRFCYQTSF